MTMWGHISPTDHGLCHLGDMLGCGSDGEEVGWCYYVCTVQPSRLLVLVSSGTRMV